MNELADATLPAPAAAPQPLAEPAPAQAATLPSPLDAVQAGQVPAVSMSAFDEANPLHEFVVSNFEELPKLGVDYLDLEGADNLSVLFNPKVITADQIQAAFKAGKLEEIAPLVDAAPAQEAVPAETAAVEAPAAPAAALANEVVAAAAPAPQRGLQDARFRNVQAVVAPKVNTPTGGPAAALARRAF